MLDIIKNIKNDLVACIDEKIKNNYQRFFKEPVLTYGCKSAEVKKIANKYWKDIKNFSKKDIMILSEKLLKSDYCEESFLVTSWWPKMKDHLEVKDFKVFEVWIAKYINNWAKCDSFCNHTMGELIRKFPNLINQLKDWARSNNRWLKRAAVVSLIIPARKGEFLNEALMLADILLLDQDDLVQKGYGWLLKEVSRCHLDEVFAYVMKNKDKMPRTALRYAIELMPKDLKKKAMIR